MPARARSTTSHAATGGYDGPAPEGLPMTVPADAIPSFFPPVWQTRTKAMCLSSDEAGGVFREEKAAGMAVGVVPMPVSAAVQHVGSNQRVPTEHPTADRPACVMLDLPAELSAMLVRLAETIDPDHRHEKGVERVSHITCKYGLTCSVEEVKAALADHGPVEYQLGEFRVFHKEDKDVLYVDVLSPDLHKLNRVLSALPCREDEYGKYIPHITLAYLKAPSRGAHPADVYAAAWNGAVQLTAQGTADELTYSGPDEVPVRVPLTSVPARVGVEQVREKGCRTVAEALAEVGDDDPSGLAVYRHDDGPVYWIDQMDWHDGKLGKRVISAAEKELGVKAQEGYSTKLRERGPTLGEPAVFVFNEGPNPTKLPGGDGWKKMSVQSREKGHDQPEAKTIWSAADHDHEHPAAQHVASEALRMMGATGPEEGTPAHNARQFMVELARRWKADPEGGQAVLDRLRDDPEFREQILTHLNQSTREKGMDGEETPPAQPAKPVKPVKPPKPKVQKQPKAVTPAVETPAAEPAAPAPESKPAVAPVEKPAKGQRKAAAPSVEAPATPAEPPATPAEPATGGERKGGIHPDVMKHIVATHELLHSMGSGPLTHEHLTQLTDHLRDTTRAHLDHYISAHDIPAKSGNKAVKAARIAQRMIGSRIPAVPYGLKELPPESGAPKQSGIDDLIGSTLDGHDHGQGWAGHIAGKPKEADKVAATGAGGKRSAPAAPQSAERHTEPERPPADAEPPAADHPAVSATRDHLPTHDVHVHAPGEPPARVTHVEDTPDGPVVHDEAGGRHTGQDLVDAGADLKATPRDDATRDMPSQRITPPDSTDPAHPVQRVQPGSTPVKIPGQEGMDDDGEGEGESDKSRTFPNSRSASMPGGTQSRTPPPVDPAVAKHRARFDDPQSGLDPRAAASDGNRKAVAAAVGNHADIVAKNFTSPFDRAEYYDRAADQHAEAKAAEGAMAARGKAVKDPIPDIPDHFHEAHAAARREAADARAKQRPQSGAPGQAPPAAAAPQSATDHLPPAGGGVLPPPVSSSRQAFQSSPVPATDAAGRKLAPPVRKADAPTPTPVPARTTAGTPPQPPPATPPATPPAGNDTPPAQPPAGGQKAPKGGAPTDRVNPDLDAMFSPEGDAGGDAKGGDYMAVRRQAVADHLDKTGQLPEEYNDPSNAAKQSFDAVIKKFGGGPETHTRFLAAMKAVHAGGPGKIDQRWKSALKTAFADHPGAGGAGGGSHPTWTSQHKKLAGLLAESGHGVLGRHNPGTKRVHVADPDGQTWDLSMAQAGDVADGKGYPHADRTTWPKKMADVATGLEGKGFKVVGLAPSGNRIVVEHDGKRVQLTPKDADDTINAGTIKSPEHTAGAEHEELAKQFEQAGLGKLEAYSKTTGVYRGVKDGKPYYVRKTDVPKVLRTGQLPGSPTIPKGEEADVRAVLSAHPQLGKLEGVLPPDEKGGPTRYHLKADDGTHQYPTKTDLVHLHHHGELPDSHGFEEAGLGKVMERHKDGSIVVETPDGGTRLLTAREMNDATRSGRLPPAEAPADGGDGQPTATGQAERFIKDQAERLGIDPVAAEQKYKFMLDHLQAHVKKYGDTQDTWNRMYRAAKDTGGGLGGFHQHYADAIGRAFRDHPVNTGRVPTKEKDVRTSLAKEGLGKLERVTDGGQHLVTGPDGRLRSLSLAQVHDALRTGEHQPARDLGRPTGQSAGQPTQAGGSSDQPAAPPLSVAKRVPAAGQSFDRGTIHDPDGGEPAGPEAADEQDVADEPTDQGGPAEKRSLLGRLEDAADRDILPKSVQAGLDMAGNAVSRVASKVDGWFDRTFGGKKKPATTPATPLPKLQPQVQSKVDAVGQKLAAVYKSNPAAIAALKRNDGWARKMAAMHAHKVVHRFGGDAKKAEETLYGLIRHLAFAAHTRGVGKVGQGRLGNVGLKVRRLKGLGFDPAAFSDGREAFSALYAMFA